MNAGKEFLQGRDGKRGALALALLAFTLQCLFSELFGISIMYSRLLSQTELGSDLKNITDLPIKPPEDQFNIQATGYVMWFTTKLIHFHINNLYM